MVEKKINKKVEALWIFNFGGGAYWGEVYSGVIPSILVYY
jgi:hypothetical protein